MNTTDFRIPVFHTFRNGNVYTGSFKGMRYRIAPVRDADKPEENCLLASVWWEDVCFDLCEIQAEERFPLVAEGLEDTLRWLVQQYGEMQQR